MSTTKKAKRKLDTAASGNDAVSADLKILAQTHYVEKLAANKHNTAQGKARKELLAGMLNAEIKSFSFEAMIDGKKTTIKAEIETPQRSYVDVEQLRKLVDEETFLKIVEASQKAVTNQVGTVIATQCLKTEEGTTNVTVTVGK